jgi:hypothetical protein
MDDLLLDRYDDFRIIYLDVVRGYTYCEELKCYVRHLTDFDVSVLTAKKKDFERKEAADGLLSEKDKLKEVISQGEWSIEKEDDIASLRFVISDNTKLVERMDVPEQKRVIQKIIDEKKEELKKIEHERLQFLYPNLETSSFEYYLDILPQYCMFKDISLKIPLHSSIEYEDTLSEEAVGRINKAYALSTDAFSEKNMRILATMPFVINQLSYCKKNILSFMHKPIVDFSSYQMDVYSRTMRNLSILESADGEPPDVDSSTKIQDVLDWYDLNYSILQGKNKNQDADGVRTSKTYQKR